MIQLIAIQIKLQMAGFILSSIEFLFIYSPINAPINGHNRIPRIHAINQTIVQIAAHRVQ